MQGQQSQAVPIRHCLFSGKELLRIGTFLRLYTLDPLKQYNKTAVNVIYFWGIGVRLLYPQLVICVRRQ